MFSCLTALSSVVLSLSAQPLLTAPILAFPLSEPLLAQTVLAQATERPADDQPVEQVTDQQVRPLPGQLNSVPVFNSNSPELVADPGILLSTFPPDGMANPAAHLNYAFEGRFDVFAHHVYKAADYDEDDPKLLDSLYLGVLIHNPSDEPVTVRTLAGASYLSQPDAPFISLPPFVPFNPRSPVFAGPGSRGMGDILQGRRSDIFPPVITIQPGENELFFNQPIPIRELVPPINGRSTLALLESSGPVYVASLAQMAQLSADGEERAPSKADWEQLLVEGNLAGPRDREPTPLPLAEGAQLIYGRVAGVSIGSEWEATLVDPVEESTDEERTDEGNTDEEGTDGEGTDSEHKLDHLTIPASGEGFAYGISLLYGGTMGTGQIQTAEMAVRYPDTAYQAHGNYGVRYDLTLPLHNPTEEEQTVDVIFQTAIKEETLSQGGLRFLEPPAPQTFFRGPVQVRYQDDNGFPRVRNIHLVQRRGQKGQPLATITLSPNETRTVSVDLLYPADSTPPQVLTIQTR